jgi:hypothetical protein
MADAAEAADAALPAVPLEGISPAALRAFCAAHAGAVLQPTAAEVDAAAAAGEAAPTALPFEALTTAQVVQRVIKPATLHTQGSYAKLLLQRAAPGAAAPPVARATVFLSHAWAYPFRDLTAAVFARFEGAEDGVFLWNGARVGLSAPARAGSANHVLPPSSPAAACADALHVCVLC